MFYKKFKLLLVTQNEEDNGAISWTQLDNLIITRHTDTENLQFI